MEAMQRERMLDKQRVYRLKKQVMSLKRIVSKLRKKHALSGLALDCLDSIAESDVSEFLKRYAKNQENLQKLDDKENNNGGPRKRLWKCQRKQKGVGISREKYPPALRCFAMTLHFYSPKAYGFVRRKFCNALPDPKT